MSQDRPFALWLTATLIALSGCSARSAAPKDPGQAAPAAAEEPEEEPAKPDHAEEPTAPGLEGSVDEVSLPSTAGTLILTPLSQGEKAIGTWLSHQREGQPGLVTLPDNRGELAEFLTNCAKDGSLEVIFSLESSTDKDKLQPFMNEYTEVAKDLRLTFKTTTFAVVTAAEEGLPEEPAPQPEGGLGLTGIGQGGRKPPSNGGGLGLTGTGQGGGR